MKKAMHPQCFLKNRYSIFVAVFIISLLTTYNFVNAQLITGGLVVGNEFYGRPWNLVTNDEPYVVLRGQLLEYHTNKGTPPLHDWDLCIFVLPRGSDYEGYAVNSLGSLNPEIYPNPEGSIELEVVTLGNSLNDNPVNKFEDFFSNLFKTNKEVEAYGLWVQDWGHEPWNPKTELHPLYYLKQTNENVTSFFAPCDVSNRFYSQYIPSRSELSIPLNAFRGISTINNSVSNFVSLSTIIQEESMMDISTNKRSSIYRTISLFPSSPRYNMSVSFGKPSSIDRAANGGGIEDAGQGHYHPFYLGKITTDIDYGALHHNVQLSVVNCSDTDLDPSVYPPSSKVMEIVFEPSLEGSNYVSSYWKLSKQNPVGDLNNDDFDIQITGNTSTNRGHFIRYYSPILGLDNTRWLLVVRSASQSDAYTVTSNKAGQGASELSFLYAEQIYSLQPSELKLEIPVSGSYYTSLESLGYAYMCTTPDTIVNLILSAIPGLDEIPGSRKWMIKKIYDRDGNPVPSATPTTELTYANSPWIWSGIEINIDPGNPDRLLFSREDDAKTIVNITATLTTNIGEDLSASINIPGAINCHLDPGSNLFIEDIVKAEIAAEMLAERGLIVDDIPELIEGDRTIEGIFGREGNVPWPPTREYKDRFKGGTGGQPPPTSPDSQFFLPEPHKITSKLSGEPKRAIEALYKMAAGFQLSSEEFEVLTKFADFGSKLKWSQSPPKNAFDNIKKSFNFR